MVDDNNNDLPKSILVVLVLLAVMISVLGTFTVLHEMKNFKTAQVYGSENQDSGGRIALELQDMNKGKGFGEVRLGIEENPEG